MTSNMISVSLILLGFTSSLCSANLFDEAGSIRGRARNHEAGTADLHLKENGVDDDEPSKIGMRRYPGFAGNRIINGEMADINEYPFMVSLKDSSGHFCGGSLIAKNVVLSAAHCQGGDYEIALGRHNVLNGGQVMQIDREVPHEDYDDSTTDNDYMLIFLTTPAELVEDEVGLIGLNKNPALPAAGDVVTVMGWGVVDTETGDLSDVLMEVDVDVITNEDCEISSDGTDNYNGQITENMLCAMDMGEDSCQGDSGGPLVLLGDTPLQVGVVSWGIGCADPSFPGVYSRVSQAYDWIVCEVCKGSQYAAEAGFVCPPNCVSDDGGNSSGGGVGDGGGGSQNNPDLEGNGPDDDNDSLSVFDGVEGFSEHSNEETLFPTFSPTLSLNDSNGGSHNQHFLSVFDAVGGFSEQSNEETLHPTFSPTFSPTLSPAQ